MPAKKAKKATIPRKKLEAAAKRGAREKAKAVRESIKMVKAAIKAFKQHLRDSEARLRKLLREQATVRKKASRSFSRMSRKELETQSLDTFAHDVKRTARARGVKRFGGDRAFISSIWDAMPPRTRGTLQAFKASLIEAHRKGLLTLTRADLVGAMDPELVARSETNEGRAQFHFVVLE